MQEAALFLIPFAVILGAVIIGILDWYRKKELQDLRTMDLRILALDEGWEFIEEDKAIHSILANSKVAYVSNGMIRNVIQKQDLGYRAAVFDYYFVTEGKNKRTIILTGVALRFNLGGLHNLKITQKTFWDRFSDSGYPRIQPSKLPNRLKNVISVFAPVEFHSRVSDWLNDNSKVQDIVANQKFRGLFCNDTRAVLYLHGRYDATEQGYAEIMRSLDELLSAFGINAAEWHANIKLLKQSASQ